MTDPAMPADPPSGPSGHPAAGDVPPLSADVFGAGPPLVFLHGAWTSNAMWGRQVAAFADRYRVIAVDLPGHGRTGPARDGGYGVGRAADRLRALLDRLDVGPAVVCGCSLGGLVAASVAARHPDRVSGLVLAGTPRSVPPAPLAGLSNLVPAGPVRGSIRLLGPGVAYDALLEGIEGTLGRPWIAVTPAARRYARREVERLSPAAFAGVFGALADARPLDGRGIDVPTQLVWGDHEAPSVVAGNRALARRIDGAETAAVPDAGHLANLDNPAAFDAAVEALLARAG